VLLKSGEGAVEFLFSEIRQELAKLLPRLSPEDGQAVVGGLRELKARYEYHEFGGAPLLGIRGACIICHGSSDARAIRNAVRVAAIMAEDKISREIVEALADAPEAPGSTGAPA
jgi:glycerol-3-phosphate acyltransferase PlsX